MKKFTIVITCMLLLLQTNLYAQRGSIENAILLAKLTPEQVMQNLQLYLDETSYPLVDLFTSKTYSVNAVKIIYNTIDGRGNPTTASGVVFLPAAASTTYLPVFSYLHGTLTRDFDAPSNLQGIESIIGWIMAMDGYISVLPDYIGMGDGPGVHPYQHAASEASASVDMLKAAISYCSSTAAKPNGNLYLSGYSQGAHAALATQNELQLNPIPGLELRKTVAGSGAYSLSNVQKNYLFKHPVYPSPSFLPYLLLGYQEVYGNLYGNLNQVFENPYYSTIPGLFNGLNTVDEIDNALPDYWKTMFNRKYLWNIQYNYFHPVNVSLRKNDVIHWKPTTDLHLYYCTCDELVANENSTLAWLSFVLRGSNKVSCLPVGPFQHAECAPFVLLLAKIQFDCASGANPCGINLLSLLKSATETNLTDFTTAVMQVGQFPVADEILQNTEMLAYLNETTISDNIQVFPNPAADMVNIQLPVDGPQVSRISVFDMQGRLLIDKTFTTATIQLNVEPLQNGVYQMVLNGKSTSLKTLVILK